MEQGRHIKYINIHFFNNSEYIFAYICNTDYYIDYTFPLIVYIFSSTSLTTKVNII
jgi:hypothetical protein